MNDRSTQRNKVRDPIGKALGVLRWFMEEPTRNVGVRELAAELNVSPSSTHRILSALVKEGFLQSDGTNGLYSLSLETIRLAHVVMAGIPLREIALRHMRKFVDACNETVYLGIYDQTRKEIFFGTHIESTQPLRYAVDTEHWVPVYAGASGLAVMAFLPETERQEIVRHTRLAPLTERTITEPYMLEEALSEIRDKGYAITYGQRIIGAVGISAPIFGPAEQVIGDVSTSIPEQRFRSETEKHLAPRVMQCANDVSREIGGRSYSRRSLPTEPARSMQLQV